MEAPTQNIYLQAGLVEIPLNEKNQEELFMLYTRREKWQQRLLKYKTPLFETLWWLCEWERERERERETEDCDD